MATYEMVNPGDVDSKEVLFSVVVSDSGFGAVGFLVWADDEDDFEGVEEAIVDYLVDNQRYINEYVWEPKAALEAMGVEETEENYDKMVDGQFDDFRMAGSGSAWFIDSHQWSYAIVDPDGELYDYALEACEEEQSEPHPNWDVSFPDGRTVGQVRAANEGAALNACAKAYGLLPEQLVAAVAPMIVELEE